MVNWDAEAHWMMFAAVVQSCELKVDAAKVAGLLKVADPKKFGDCTAKALSHQMAALRKDCKKYWQGKDGVPYPTVAGTTIGPATPNSRKRNTPAKQENDGDDGASSEIDTPTKKKSKAGKKLSSKATEVGGIEHAGGSGDAEVKDEIEV